MKRLVQNGFDTLKRLLGDRKLDDRTLFFYGAAFVVTAARQAAKMGVTYAMEKNRMIEKRSLEKLFLVMHELTLETNEFLKTEPVGTTPKASDDVTSEPPA